MIEEKIMGIEFAEGESSCCGAKVYRDTDICADCGEHCETVNYACSVCKDKGYVEIMGDGPNFECDVIGYKKCSNCNLD